MDVKCMSNQLYDVIIIGAGQAGIAMSYQLKQNGVKKHLMLEACKRIGDSWRNRYKSLVLFTPKSYSALPGLTMKGNPNSYPTKDEMADYLESYVAYFDLPHRLNVSVQKVQQDNGYFSIHTSTERLRSKKVVIATGAFQKPYIPPVTKKNNDISQIHSFSYTEPKDLDDGSVLIVGGGNSGAQIAVELAKDRNVTLAVSHKLKFLPLQLLRKSIFYWLEKLRLLDAGIDTTRGRQFRKRNDPIFGKELKEAIKNQKVKIKPRVTKVNGNYVMFADDSSMNVDQIIWATGFVPSYGFIHINGAIDLNGRPIHTRGVSPIRGLYYIGLPWQYSRSSALVCGVAKDAKFLADKMFC